MRVRGLLARLAVGGGLLLTAILYGAFVAPLDGVLDLQESLFIGLMSVVGAAVMVWGLVRWLGDRLACGFRLMVGRLKDTRCSKRLSYWYTEKHHTKKGEGQDATNHTKRRTSRRRPRRTQRRT